MDIEIFKALLQTRKNVLLNMIERGKAATQIVELDQASIGRVTRVDAMQVQAMAIATIQRKQAELNKIEAALIRIDQEEYGYCIACDMEIPEDRLEVDPTTLLCINCAIKRETDRE